MTSKTLIIVLLLLTACASIRDPIAKSLPPENAAEQAFYVVNHDWHTGFIVPAEAMQSRIPELKKAFGDTPYLEFGWGDKDFYLAKEVTTGLTLRASLWSTESVIHVAAVPLHAPAHYASSEVRALCLTAPQQSALLSFIANSFYLTREGNIVELQEGVNQYGRFFKAVGKYTMFNTCNSWTAKGLKSIGLDIHPAFNLVASSVMKNLAALPCAQ